MVVVDWSVVELEDELAVVLPLVAEARVKAPESETERLFVFHSFQASLVSKVCVEAAYVLYGLWKMVP